MLTEVKKRADAARHGAFGATRSAPMAGQWCDTWSLLRGMASVAPPVAGATVVPADGSVCCPQGTSLLLARLAYEEQLKLRIDNIKTTYYAGLLDKDDPDWCVAAIGDLLIGTNGDPGIVEVSRIGYGIYNGQFRVVHAREDRDCWQHGSWRSRSLFTRLVSGMMVETTCDIPLEDGDHIRPGAQATVIAIQPNVVCLQFWDMEMDLLRGCFDMVRLPT